MTFTSVIPPAQWLQSAFSLISPPPSLSQGRPCGWRVNQSLGLGAEQQEWERGSEWTSVWSRCCSCIVEVREEMEMDSRSRMEGLARDECELDDWFYKEDKKGEVQTCSM